MAEALHQLLVADGSNNSGSDFTIALDCQSNGFVIVEPGSEVVGIFEAFPQGRSQKRPLIGRQFQGLWSDLIEAHARSLPDFTGV